MQHGVPVILKAIMNDPDKKGKINDNTCISCNRCSNDISLSKA